MRHRLLLLASILILGAFACGGDDDGGFQPDCDGPVPTYGELTILEICTMCHSSELLGEEERMEAPEDINFDTYEGAVASNVDAIGVLTNGAMPPPEVETRPTEQQKEDFITWAACGTPP